MTRVQRFIGTPPTTRQGVLVLLAAIAVSIGSIAAPLATSAHADELEAGVERQTPPMVCRFEPAVSLTAEVTPRCPAATASPTSTPAGVSDGRKPGIAAGQAYASPTVHVTDEVFAQASGSDVDGANPAIIGGQSATGLTVTWDTPDQASAPALDGRKPGVAGGRNESTVAVGVAGTWRRP